MSSELFLQENKPLSTLCTFGIGGPARYFLEVRTVEQMQQALSLCKANQWNYFILGKGSNCLFDDLGFHGAVILNKIDFIQRPSPETFHVGAGYSFSLLGVQSARQGYEGLEFASGIPGSVGGAVFMNAGANGMETCQSLTSVDYLSHEGVLSVLKREELTFSYRKSSFQKMAGVIVGATFTLNAAQEARKKQIEIVNYRKATQPYGEKSAGCIFRNPPKGHAGALIDQNGLKGKNIGGAKISLKHGNFIVNEGHATAKDVVDLIQLIKNQIIEKTGVALDVEICRIPYLAKDIYE